MDESSTVSLRVFAPYPTWIYWGCFKAIGRYCLWASGWLWQAMQVESLRHSLTRKALDEFSVSQTTGIGRDIFQYWAHNSAGSTSLISTNTFLCWCIAYCCPLPLLRSRSANSLSFYPDRLVFPISRIWKACPSLFLIYSLLSSRVISARGLRCI
jgi:hypothetical protein